MSKKQMPAGPCKDGAAHFWLLVAGHDAQGRSGSHGRCKVCRRTRFYPNPSMGEAHRAYGRLPKKAAS